jgi:hypothetical protein
VYDQPETCAQPCAPTIALRRCAYSIGTASPCPPRRLLRAGRALALASFALAIFTPGAQAAKPENTGSTSRSTRDEAIRSIPTDKLSESGQQKVASVLKQISIFRRLPTQVIECDPNLYLFLIEHPEMVVNMWEVMDVSDMKLEKVGPDQYKMNDGAGTIGKVEMLWHTHDLHVMFAEGAYSGPMFAGAVKGRCLLVLKTGYVRETNGKYYITCRLDTFIQLENVGLEFVARTFQPMIGKTADHNFRETAAFMAMISRSAEVQHPSLRKLTEQLTVPTDADRAEFVSITNRIGDTARELESHQGVAEQTAALAPAASKPATARQPSKPLAMAPARASTTSAKTPPPSSSSGAPTTSNWPKAPIPGGTRKTVMKPSTAR